MLESLDIDDNDNDGPPPPHPDPRLPSFLASECKFWGKVVAGPVTFAVANTIVELVADKVFWNQDYYDAKSNQHVLFSSKVFLLDALLLYLAASYLQKQVHMLDIEMRESEQEQEQDIRPTRSNESRQTLIFAHASHKLDVLLGRSKKHQSLGTRSSTLQTRDGLELDGGRRSATGGSVFVSLLLLGSVKFVSMGLASIVQVTFSHTAFAKLGCHNERAKQDFIPGLPDDLQEWSKYGSQLDPFEWDAPDNRHIIHLNEGTTFVLTTIEVAPNDASSSSAADHAPGRHHSPLSPPDSALVAIPSGSMGIAQVLSNVIRPHSFLILSDNGREDTLHAPGFCCLYETHVATPSLVGDIPPLPVSMMCYYTNSSDSALLFGTSTGQVRNVSLDIDHSVRARRQYPAIAPRVFITWYNNCVWVCIRNFLDHRTTIDIFNVTVTTTRDDAGSESLLQLNPVVSVVTKVWCGMWSIFVHAGTTVAIWMASSCWLWYIRKMPVGVVPAYGALLLVGGHISTTAEVVIRVLTFTTSLVSLFGCNVLSGTVLGRCLRRGEEWVWLFYVTMASAVSMRMKIPGEELAGTVVVIVASVVIGAILGHPVLYLAGWIGGVGCIAYGFLGVTLGWFSFDVLLALIALGVIGGVGGITVGRLCIRHDALIRFHAKRAWNRVQTRLLSQPQVMGAPPENRREAATPAVSMTTGLLRDDDTA